MTLVFAGFLIVTGWYCTTKASTVMVEASQEFIKAIFELCSKNEERKRAGS
jgi:archaellin